jgi:hypothetical protein
MPWADRGAGAASAYLGDDLTEEDAFAAVASHALSRPARRAVAERPCQTRQLAVLDVHEPAMCPAVHTPP